MSLATGRLTRGRPLGALFVGLLFVAQVAHSSCPATRIHARADVDYVHDGDTVRLADGRSLRIVGIDTPELARDGRPDEPLARAARDRVRELLRASAMRLSLRYDAEAKDRYGRTLAHAYLPDGRSVGAMLLAEGLATLLVVPPNDADWSCYRDAERRARAGSLGLWALPGYRVLEATEIDPARRGVVVLHGRVRAVEPKRPGVRVVLDGGLVAWVPRDALGHFDDLDGLVGKRVEVRGRLRRYREELQVTVRHPAALDLLGGEARQDRLGR